MTDLKDGKSNVIDANIVRGGNWYGLDTLLFNANNKTYSTKIKFNTGSADNDYSNFIIKKLRDSPTEPKKATIFGDFFGKVFFGTLGLNNTIITYIFSFLYSWLAESIIIFIAPILLGGLFGISYIFNFIIFIYYYIVNIGSIFKEIVINDGEVKYESLNFEKPIGFFWAAINFVLWMILFWFGLFFYPPFMMIYSLISPLFIKGTNVTNKTEEKTIGFGTFCQNVLWYKGPLFLFLTSIGLLTPAKKYLGNTGFLASVCAVIFCIIGLHWYNISFNPEEDSKNLSEINTNYTKESLNEFDNQKGGKIKKRKNKETKRVNN